MKIIFSIIVLLLFIFFGGHVTISFKSPYIYVERPWIVVGVILLSLAIGALQYDSIKMEIFNERALCVAKRKRR